jgi:hypothetical protein
MNTQMNVELIGGLKSLYDRDQTAKALLDKLSERKNGAKFTKAKRAATITGEEYRRVIAAFKEFEGLGLGRFVAGRKGHDSRMEWAFDVRTLGPVARGVNSKLAEVPLDAEDDDEGNGNEYETESALIIHAFQLRPNCSVEITLPADVTQKEVERLGMWLRSIPFE